MEQKRMNTGIMNALSAVLAVRNGTKVIIITDNEKLNIAKAIFNSAESLGADTKIYSLPLSRPLKEVPLELLQVIEQHRRNVKDSVFINAFSGLGEETPMRVSLIQKEMEIGARVGHAPGINERMIVQGPMNVDYKALVVIARTLIRRFEGAKSVWITSPSGTHIVLNIENRAFETDVEVMNGSVGNLPAGEVWCAPIEDGADGIIVSDGSVGDLGPVKKPIKLTVNRGKLIKLSGGTQTFMNKLKLLLDVAQEARIIGELGIGLNPGA